MLVRDRALRHSISSAIIYNGPKQSHGIHLYHDDYNTEGCEISDIGKRSEQMVKLERKFKNRKVVKLTLDTQKSKGKKKVLGSAVYEPIKKAQTNVTNQQLLSAVYEPIKKAQTNVANQQLLIEYDCNIQNSSGDVRVSQWVITDSSCDIHCILPERGVTLLVIA